MTNPFDFFTLGFTNFVKAWKIALNIFIKLIIPFIVCMLVIFLIIGIGTATFFSSTLLANKTTFLTLIIIAIIAYIASIIWLATQTYYYSFSNVIAIENPEITPKKDLSLYHYKGLQMTLEVQKILEHL